MQTNMLFRAESILRGMDVKGRANLLLEGLAFIESNADMIVATAQRDTGKLSGDLVWELEESIAFGRDLAGRAEDWLADSALDTGDPTTSATLLWEPLGACLAIKPYNYPIELPMWTIASNILAGNPVVLKPSEDAARTGSQIVSLFEEGSGGYGLVQAVIGGPETAVRLIKQHSFACVSFTGSNGVARSIASSINHLKTRLVVEGQGADCAVVLDTDVLDYALPGIAWGAFFNLGLVCVATKQVLVPSGTERSVGIRLANSIPDFEVSLPSTGSLPKRARDAYRQQLLALGRNGCQFFTTGAREIDSGTLHELEPGTPIVAVAPPETQVSNTAFGPITVVRPYINLEEASSIVSTSEHGLGLSVWSTSERKALAFARNRHVGMTWINDINLAAATVPWLGGWGSGMGAELGELGLHTYSRARVIFSRSDKAGPREYWYDEQPTEERTPCG